MADGALMSFHVLNTLLMVFAVWVFCVGLFCMYLEISFQSSDSTLTAGGSTVI